MTAPQPHLLLLHGFTGSGASWQEVKASLPAEWTLFSPDLLGHASAGGVGASSFGEEVERLQGELASRRECRWHLAGYSLGARVGLGLLATSPQSFASATLIGVNWGLESEAERRARRKQDEAWAELLEVEGLDAFLARWEALPLFSSQRGLEPARLARQRKTRSNHRAEGLAQALRVLGLGAMPDYRDRLTLFAGEVRLVVGESDAKYRRIAGEMLSWWPASRLDLVPGAGHNVPLEAPSEVARILFEVVAESGDCGSSHASRGREGPARGGGSRGHGGQR